MWWMTVMMTSLVLAGQVENPTADEVPAVDDAFGLMEQPGAEVAASEEVESLEVELKDVEVLRRAAPRVGGPSGIYTCVVRIELDGGRKPVHVEMIEASECSEFYQKETLWTAKRWRFKPYLVDGEPTPASFVLSLTYKRPPYAVPPASAGQVESPNADAAQAVDEELGLVERVEAPQDVDAPLAVHWSEVKVREPVKGDSIAPATPPSGNGETVCDVRFFVDETGAPYDVKIEDCPEEYSDGVLETARRTLFEPLVIDGEAVKHQFVSRTTYRWWSKSPPTSGRAQAVVGLHWSEVSRNGRVAPSVPGDAPVRRVEPRVEARCTVGVFVDDRGRPSATVVSGCDSAHAASSEAFVKKWRFEPHHVDGEAVPFFLEIHIRRYRVSHKPF